MTSKQACRATQQAKTKRTSVGDAQRFFFDENEKMGRKLALSAGAPVDNVRQKLDY